MINLISSISLVLVGSIGLVLGAYPATYSVGYGFVSHGGIGPHGHYLPATASVKIHKDPFQNHYSLDEEGPTHYKYVRHSSPTHPVIHEPPVAVIDDHHHHHHHGHGHHHVAAIAAPAVPVHGGIIGDVHHGHHDGHHGHGHHEAIAVPAVGLEGDHFYNYNDYGYGGFHHGGGAYY